MKKVLGLLVVSLLFPSIALGQENAAGVGISIPLVDTAENGSVICAKGLSFGMCDETFSPNMIGVLADNAAVALEAIDPQEQRLIVNHGVVKVRVSSQFGDITEGDFVTATAIPGVVAKAAGNGYVLGTALEDYQSNDPTEVGQIAVAVNVHLRAGLVGDQTNLWFLLRNGLSSTSFQPIDSLRYLIAALVVLVSFTFGILYFGRVARAGVEAIGRNPLARSSIQLGIVLSILLSFVMIMVGLGLAYLILVL